MPATAKIHSKVKSQQVLHVKNIEAVQGPNHWTVESIYSKRVLSYTHVRLPVKGLTQQMQKEAQMDKFEVHWNGLQFFIVVFENMLA